MKRHGTCCRALAVVGAETLLFAIATGWALAHVSVAPVESPPGVEERYAIRVPGEKPIPTVRVEVQFPPGATVNAVEAVAGWTVSVQREGSGRVVSAAWDGGMIPSGQYVEFGVLARNPDSPRDLRWQAIQTYQDGSEVQWIGSPDSQFPATVTHVRTSGVTFGRTDIVAMGGALLSVLAMVLVGATWRTARRRTTTSSQ